MKKNRLFAIIFAIVLLGSGAIVAILMLSSSETEEVINPVPGTEEVVDLSQPQMITSQFAFAIKPIPRGTEIKLDMVILRETLDNVPPNVYTNLSPIIGKVVKTDILQGQLILPAMLQDSNRAVVQRDRGCIPTVADQGVCYDRYDTAIYGFDRALGHEIWRVEANAVFPTLTVAENTAYYWDHQSHLRAIDTETGQEQWRYYETSAPYIEPSAKPLFVEGMLLFWNETTQMLQAVAAETGEAKWQFAVPHLISEPVLVADNTIAFIGGDGYKYAVHLQTGYQFERTRLTQ
ncbi:MAG: PQQ-binding-like beta-propeller repeat protein [Chloroflexota bacterium]